MKDNKQFWTTVLISAIVAVVVFLLLGFASGGVMFGPLGPFQRAEPQAPGEINANSCDADGICEINNAEVSQDLNAQSGLFYQSLSIGEKDMPSVKIHDGQICFGDNCKVYWPQISIRTCFWQAGNVSGYQTCYCNYGDVATGWTGYGCEQINNNLRGCVRTTHTAISDPNGTGIQFYLDGLGNAAVGVYCYDN